MSLQYMARNNSGCVAELIDKFTTRVKDMKEIVAVDCIDISQCCHNGTICKCDWNDRDRERRIYQCVVVHLLTAFTLRHDVNKGVVIKKGKSVA